MPNIQIMPSLLAADNGRLADECRRAESAGADAIHVDIMDGHFVPNLSMGPDFVAMARDATPSLYRSVHLMLTRPDQYADPFLDAGAQTLLIHVEAGCDPVPVLRHIRDRGARPGLVLNPSTPADAVLKLDVALFDEVLCMTVNPGFGGQAFIESVLPKIEALRAAWPDMDLSVDGGIDGATGVRCAEAGANILISGSYLFRQEDMGTAILDMRHAGEAAARPRSARH